MPEIYRAPKSLQHPSGFKYRTVPKVGKSMLETQRVHSVAHSKFKGFNNSSTCLTKERPFQQGLEVSVRISRPFPASLVLLGMILCSACQLSNAPDPAANKSLGDYQLMPDLDLIRRERLQDIAGRFVTPEGFRVEQVVSDRQVGSVVNLTFDHKGRPTIAVEDGGILLLEDSDQDGIYEKTIVFSDQVETAHGMEFLGPGELLVHANGPENTGLYLLRDINGDDQSDSVELITPSVGKIAEHGPHEIELGPDGFLYVLFGNHSSPDAYLDPLSASRELREDHLLPRYLDPRGHATHVQAPGGTFYRLNFPKRHWEQIAGGLRNPFDFAIDSSGEILTFESDMEWDFGLPWYRETRVLHVIPGGDYGWRTGSSKFPSYYIDTLPSVDESGRGSPVGVTFYRHHIYPEKYRGALFMGDWSRGRIRVMFPHPEGASVTGQIVDFVHGEPLNVTDLDIGPDGFLYFSTGGRNTTGGIYRVLFDRIPFSESEGLEKILNQPMPRSAWGRLQISNVKGALGVKWEDLLQKVVHDPQKSLETRLLALETLQIHGPQPNRNFLADLMKDENPRIRAAAVFLLGTFSWRDVSTLLTEALLDPEPIVIRRAAESLTRAGLSPSISLGDESKLIDGLRACLQNTDRFARFSCRQVLRRIPSTNWQKYLVHNPNENTRLAFETLLAYAQEMRSSHQAKILFSQLEKIQLKKLDPDDLLDYLRLLQIGLIRDPRDRAGGKPAYAIGERLLLDFPHSDLRVNRELLILLSFLEVRGITKKGLTYLEQELSQEDQIHAVYCLRTVSTGWSAAERLKLLNWFQRAWEFRGAASMEGFIGKLWDSTLELLTPSEIQEARHVRETFLNNRTSLLAAYLEKDEDYDPNKIERTGSRLANMSFEELSNSLEYDPMSYERGSVERGRKVFHLSKCVNCHVFGTEGRGGGPDLSTVVSRFRRREILESMMFPSRVISDQYTALDLQMLDGTKITGMLAGENDTTLTLINASGEVRNLPKNKIGGRQLSTESLMPEGLLDSMTKRDLVSLILFLEAGSAKEK